MTILFFMTHIFFKIFEMRFSRTGQWLIQFYILEQILNPQDLKENLKKFFSFKNSQKKRAKILFPLFFPQKI